MVLCIVMWNLRLFSRSYPKFSASIWHVPNRFKYMGYSKRQHQYHVIRMILNIRSVWLYLPSILKFIKSHPIQSHAHLIQSRPTPSQSHTPSHIPCPSHPIPSNPIPIPYPIPLSELKKYWKMHILFVNNFIYRKLLNLTT